MNNIKLIKEFKLFKIFIDTTNEYKFYSKIIDQMKKITDIKNIFEIFPLKYINKNFTFKINECINKLKYTMLDEDIKAYKDILTNWILINKYHSLDMNYVLDIIFINNYIPTQYFIHLLNDKNENNKFIINLMKDRILEINIDRAPELFIDLLIT